MLSIPSQNGMAYHKHVTVRPGSLSRSQGTDTGSLYFQLPVLACSELPERLYPQMVPACQLPPLPHSGEGPIDQQHRQRCCAFEAPTPVGIHPGSRGLGNDPLPWATFQNLTVVWWEQTQRSVCWALLLLHVGRQHPGAASSKRDFFQFVGERLQHPTRFVRLQPEPARSP